MLILHEVPMACAFLHRELHNVSFETLLWLPVCLTDDMAVVNVIGVVVSFWIAILGTHRNQSTCLQHGEGLMAKIPRTKR